MQRIIIDDPVRLRQAIAFAESVGAADELARGLLRLLNLAASFMVTSNGDGQTSRVDYDVEAKIGYDFAPHSFGWYVLRKDAGGKEQIVINGGFIYHGPTSPGDGSFPALSVSLDHVMGNAPTHSWSIHT
jgi:hypothetical protein